jgi:hypothetical protein
MAIPSANLRFEYHSNAIPVEELPHLLGEELDAYNATHNPDIDADVEDALVKAFGHLNDL